MWFKVWLRTGGPLAIVGLATGTLLILDENDVPDAAFWDRNGRWILAAALASAVVAFLEPTWHTVRDGLRARRDRQGRALDELLRANLMAISQAAVTVPWYAIGLHVWEVRRAWNFRKRLVRRACLRVEHKGTGPATWPKGLGVVGYCWLDQDAQACNFKKTEKYVTNGDRDGWMKLSARERWGLDWNQLRQANRYGGIFAVPMYEGEKAKFAGCVSLDGPPGSFAALNAQSVQKLLRQCARSTASALYYAADGGNGV